MQTIVMNAAFKLPSAARFINKEGRNDFRNLYYLKNKIYARHTNHNYGWRRR